MLTDADVIVFGMFWMWYEVVDIASLVTITVSMETHIMIIIDYQCSVWNYHFTALSTELGESSEIYSSLFVLVLPKGYQ